ncbi:MAG: HD-GYP domain-containing protein [Oscillospiraceae bacterium]
MEYVKLQIGCMAVLIYLAFIYVIECRRNHSSLKDTLFDELLILGIAEVFFDGVTAYAVNDEQLIHTTFNKVFHAIFLSSLDAVIFVFFLYMLHITEAFPKTKKVKSLVFLPFCVNILVVFCFSPSLEYIKGEYTNYSMGISVYTCYIMAAVYAVMSTVIFIKRWNYIETHKRVCVMTYLLILAVVSTIQMIFPEILVSSLAVTMFVIGVYMNSEDPALRTLSQFHTETVMSFANLIENRDNSTGGHIKRTSRYVQLIAEELQNRGYFSDVITKDFISNLLKAAPMHDIGKVSVPDAILQKPGKLTDEEFAEMKLHAEKGGEIILETFHNLGDEEYRKMAYEVARYHHEKWNGKGYPEGLERKEIPLSARIMAVADVFDAVSEKRCYRDAMPMDKCFDIIRQGSGQDFDPIIAETFLDIRDKVEEVHAEFAAERSNAAAKILEDIESEMEKSVEYK